MIQIKNKKVGIWGYGTVGQSVARFALQHNAHVSVMDAKTQSMPKHMLFYNEQQKEHFFQSNDYIIPSPGIDITDYLPYIKHTLLSELDLFFHFFKKPIIAITGSVGKTTITTLLTDILKQYGLRILSGGNIGNACLDMVEKQHECDYAIIEVSSFQLEHCKAFAPDIGIITNIVANHLDRHKTMDSYRNAKLQMLRAQKALLPEDLKQYVPQDILNTCTFFKADKKHTTALPPITFAQNWIIIEHVLKLLNLDIKQLPMFAHNLKTPAHRLELVATINGISFYNDSKATTPASTIAAVNQLKDRPIILLVGGLSKGVDRKALIEQLKNKVKTIVCFGKEAQQLFDWCTEYAIPASMHKTLEEAFAWCSDNAQQNDIVLLSPGGSSFDLFDNFEHRGNHFKSLTHNLHKQYDTGNQEKPCIKTKNDCMLI